MKREEKGRLDGKESKVDGGREREALLCLHMTQNHLKHCTVYFTRMRSVGVKWCWVLVMLPGIQRANKFINHPLHLSRKNESDRT